MDKEKLKIRLQNLKTLKENHEQDIVELDLVIDGITKQIEDMPEDETPKEINTT